MSSEPDMRSQLETTFARIKSEREAKEAAERAADSVPTDNVTVLRERATRHAHRAVDEYWGYFNDIQTALDQRVITPLLQTVERIAAERDEARARVAELEKPRRKRPNTKDEFGPEGGRVACQDCGWKSEWFDTDRQYGAFRSAAYFHQCDEEATR